MSTDQELTVTMFRNPVGLEAGLAVRIHDNMTPTQEVRYVQMVLSDQEMERAASPGIAWYAYMKRVVREFNSINGKKVKLINTFDLGYYEYVRVVPLPYNMGLTYCSDIDA